MNFYTKKTHYNRFNVLNSIFIKHFIDNYLVLVYDLTYNHSMKRVWV